MMPSWQGGEIAFVMGPRPSDWASAPDASALGAFDEAQPVEVQPIATWAPAPSLPTQLFRKGDTLSLASATSGATVRYTLDGSMPDENAPVFDQPLLLSDAVTVKAVAYSEGLRASSVFERSYFPTLGDARPLVSVEESDLPYGEHDGSMLVDGITGTRFYGDRDWTGRKGDLTVNLDMGKAVAASRVLVGTLEDPWNGIMPASAIEVWGGNAPDDLRRIGSVDVPAPEGLGNAVHRIAVPVDTGAEALRYYQIRVKGFGQMPRTIQPEGVVSWLFVDEVIIQ